MIIHYLFLCTSLIISFIVTQKISIKPSKIYNFSVLRGSIPTKFSIQPDYFDLGLLTILTFEKDDEIPTFQFGKASGFFFCAFRINFPKETVNTNNFSFGDEDRLVKYSNITIEEKDLFILVFPEEINGIEARLPRLMLFLELLEDHGHPDDNEYNLLEEVEKPVREEIETIGSHQYSFRIFTNIFKKKPALLAFKPSFQLVTKEPSLYRYREEQSLKFKLNYKNTTIQDNDPENLILEPHNLILEEKLKLKKDEFSGKIENMPDTLKRIHEKISKHIGSKKTVYKFGKHGKYKRHTKKRILIQSEAGWNWLKRSTTKHKNKKEFVETWSKIILISMETSKREHTFEDKVNSFEWALRLIWKIDEITDEEIEFRINRPTNGTDNNRSGAEATRNKPNIKAIILYTLLGLAIAATLSGVLFIAWRKYKQRKKVRLMIMENINTKAS